jgi:protein phosphatase
MKKRMFAQNVGTATGRGRRRVNQDAVLAVALSDGSELIAVADGMGGHAAGERASRLALNTLRAAVEGGADLVAAVRAANTAVFAEAASNPEQDGMGTTLAAMLRKGDRYSIANVGDSRVYRIDANGIEQITVDHSFIVDAVRSGELTAEEAGSSPWRNAVTRAVGTDRDVEVDCYGPFEMRDAHAVVLCTDGLYRSLDPAEVAQAVRATKPGAAAKALAAAAYAAGSDDNITVAVVSYGLWVEPVTSPAARTAPAAPGEAVKARAAPRQDDDPAFSRHAPRQRRKAGRRWARIQISAILLGLLAVMVYVFILAKTI